MKDGAAGAGEGQLDRRRRRVEVLGHRREPGQVRIDRQRTQSGEEQEPTATVESLAWWESGDGGTKG